jgi:hypothetical protein
LDYSTNLRTLLVDRIKNPLASPTGVFLPVCLFHAAQFSNDLYVNITSQGIAYNEAIAMKNGGDENIIMMNDKGTSAAGNVSQSILCWYSRFLFIVEGLVLLKNCNSYQLHDVFNLYALLQIHTVMNVLDNR